VSGGFGREMVLIRRWSARGMEWPTLDVGQAVDGCVFDEMVNECSVAGIRLDMGA
jgi:hypothetical protein